ncbi:MAG TPA: bifunctional adenosylcobinamide kinase/adenosylcobinamide-phosphate guanylyltransferase, partial [Trichocoleus sp.]
EVPAELAQAIRRAEAQTCLLVDSLGTWLANLLDQDEPTWEQTCADLVASLGETQSQVIFVAEEVGWGVVPAYPIGRLFCDRMGQLTRLIGARAHQVYLVSAGYALDLRQFGERVPGNK